MPCLKGLLPCGSHYLSCSLQVFFVVLWEQQAISTPYSSNWPIAIAFTKFQLHAFPFEFPCVCLRIKYSNSCSLSLNMQPGLGNWSVARAPRVLEQMSKQNSLKKSVHAQKCYTHTRTYTRTSILYFCAGQLCFFQPPNCPSHQPPADVAQGVPPGSWCRWATGVLWLAEDRDPL